MEETATEVKPQESNVATQPMPSTEAPAAQPETQAVTVTPVPAPEVSSPVAEAPAVPVVESAPAPMPNAQEQSVGTQAPAEVPASGGMENSTSPAFTATATPEIPNPASTEAAANNFGQTPQTPQENKSGNFFNKILGMMGLGSKSS